MARIVIIGGHGKVALLLSRILVEGGHDVTSLFRKPEQIDDVQETGATPVVFDVEHSSVEDVVEAIEGHDAVVWSAGAGGGNPERTYAVDRDAAVRSMDAAAKAGVDRYVMVSYLGADLEHGVPRGNSFYPYAEAKAAADHYLRKSDLAWTILGPGTLTLEDASGRISVDPEPRSTGRDTSRANVAQVMAAVLDDPKTIGTTIDFVDGDVPIADAIMRTR